VLEAVWTIDTKVPIVYNASKPELAKKICTCQRHKSEPIDQDFGTRVQTHFSSGGWPWGVKASKI
jgi:hypothetical protein